jgi:hypothetical protein
MKLTHNLCILMSLVSLSFCQVEVWIDTDFGDLIHKHCKTFADSKQAPQSNLLTTDVVANNPSHTADMMDLDDMDVDPKKSESTQSPDLPVSGAFKKCNGALKKEWTTTSPTAPNIIIINGKMFLFIIYSKDGDYSFPPEIELVYENMLFTRYIYKSAPQLFTETEIDVEDKLKDKQKQKLIKDFAYANSLIRRDKYDRSAAKYYEILSYLKKSSNNGDLINYIYENLAYSHSWQLDVLKNKSGVVEKDDLEEEKNDVNSSYKTIFENYLDPNKESFFNKFLHRDYAHFNGNEEKEAKYLEEASELVSGDPLLGKDLVHKGELYKTIAYLTHGLTNENNFFHTNFETNFRNLKRKIGPKIVPLVKKSLMKKRRKLKKH